MAIDSTKKNLHSLPLETLQQIADHLNHSHRPSLDAFALASKTCHDAALPSIFRHVHLTISNPEALQRDVNALAKTLSRTNSTSHVRYLSIKGFLKLPGQSSTEEDSGTSWLKSKGLDEILGKDEEYDGRHHVVYDDVIEKSSDEDLAWGPAVEFIRTLPYLTTLIYDCKNQFPPSLLDALHSHQPQCRLHHLTFRFRTLLWGIPKPYEMALATSPCLYKVKVEWSWRDSNGDDDFNLEATMELAAGLAPNLKEVEILNVVPYEQARRAYFSRPRKLWAGLPGFVRGESIGSLTSLSLRGCVRMYGIIPELQAWAQHTDFGHLRHLMLGGGYYEEHHSALHGETMETIAQDFSFPQLKTLQVGMGRYDMTEEKPNYADNAIAFLKSFEPLDELLVSGAFEPKILDAILSRHGQMLKKLSIRPIESEFSVDNFPRRRDMPMTFTEKHILQIHAKCPVLQYLALSVKRTKSDIIEAKIYKSLGKIESLKSLFLILDCSDWRVIRDPDSQNHSLFDVFDRETFPDLYFLKNGALRETLINCAVDETLARSIWETICQNKSGQKLECLKVWTTDGGHWGDSKTMNSITEVVDHLSRSWLIERRARDDEKDLINVKELGRRAREARDQEKRDRAKRYVEYLRNEEDIMKELEDITEEDPVVQVLRRVWPRKESSKDWRNDWSSLPL